VAVSLNTGKQGWSRRLSGPLVTGVMLLGDTIIAPTDLPEGKIQALRTSTGQTIWKCSTGGLVAPLVLIRNRLLAVTRRGFLLSIRPGDGSVEWRTRVGPSGAAPVTTDDSTLTLATVDSLFRISSRDGRVLARARGPGWIVSPWVRLGQLLVAGSADSSVVAIRPEDLGLAWKVRLDAPVLSAPARVGDSLFAVSRIGSVYRITADPDPSGALLVALSWAVTAPLVPFADLLLVGGSDGVVRALAHDGTEAWRLQLGRPAEIPAVVLPDGLIIMGGNGDLHRYRQ
jgi:outer membrane protein assembly factor BamB